MAGMADVNNAYTGSLARYAASTKAALAKINQAETSYGNLASIYAPGGTYGAGQKAIIARGAAEEQSNVQLGMVGTGMSSGTNAMGMGARVKRDATTAELGVEDTRADKYAQVLQGLSSLRMAAAGQIGSMAANEPSYAPYAGATTSIYSTDVGAATQRYGANLGYTGQMNASNLASQTQLQLEAMRANNAQNLQTQQLNAEYGIGGSNISRNTY